MRESWSFGRHLLAGCIAVLLLAAAASGYTIVLKGGKRVQIPERFVVTSAVLNYEVAAGMNVTLQLAAVDIAETERANNEPAGSFVQRIQKPAIYNSSMPTPIRPGNSDSVRTVTNRDLESYRVARLENEKAYEASLAETGRPSLAELRERAERESADARDFVERRSLELQAESERQRTADLERRFEELNRQMQYENDPSPWGDFYWPSGSVLVGDSFRGNRHSRFGFNLNGDRRFAPHRPRIFVAPRATHPGFSPHPGRH